MKKSLKSIITIGLTIVTCFSLLLGCGNEEKAKVNKNREITLCESWDFDSGFFTVLSPNLSSNYGPYNFLPNFYETLVNYKDGKIVPGLAEKWEISKDGLDYTFYLKKKIKFSDGKLMDANAVKTTLENVPKLLGEYNGVYGVTTTLFDKIKVIDDYTVQVHLKAPYYGALHDFTLPNTLGIMSPNAFNKDGTLSDKTKNTTLGTGAYMYDGKKEGKTYTFVRNPNYNREKPEVDKFHIKIIPDNDAKLLALRSGEIDMIVGSYNISYDAYNDLKDSKELKVLSSNESDITRLMGFNINEEPFNDKAVRQAIQHAIDKESISKDIFYGIEPSADTVLDKSLPYCDVKVKTYEFDIKKAEKILQDAGWVDNNKDGVREKNDKKLESELIYISGIANLDTLVTNITSSLGKIGIKIKATKMEINTFSQTVASGKFKMALQDTCGIPYDPYLFISNLNTEPVRNNFTAQGLKEVNSGNKLVVGLNSLIKQDEIKKSYEKILKGVHEGAALMPITGRKQLAIYNSKIISEYKFYDNPSIAKVGNVKLK